MEGGDEDTTSSYASPKPTSRPSPGPACTTAPTSAAATPDPGPRGLTDLVGDLEALLEAAAVDGPYVMVGTSGGGYISVVFAVAHPDDIAGIVLVEVPSPFVDPPPEIVELTAWDHPANIEQRDYLQVEIDAWAARTEIGDIPVTVISNDYGPDAESRRAHQRRRPTRLARPQPTRRADRGDHRPRRRGTGSATRIDAILDVVRPSVRHANRRRTAGSCSNAWSRDVDETDIYTVNADGSDVGVAVRGPGGGGTVVPGWHRDLDLLLRRRDRRPHPRCRDRRRSRSRAAGSHPGGVLRRGLVTGRRAFGLRGLRRRRSRACNGIYSIRASDGGDLHPDHVESRVGYDMPGDYSPDGTQIVFVRFQEEAPGGTLRDERRRHRTPAADTDGHAPRRQRPRRQLVAERQRHPLRRPRRPRSTTRRSGSSTPTVGARSSCRSLRRAAARAPSAERARVLLAELVAGRQADRLRRRRTLRWRAEDAMARASTSSTPTEAESSRSPTARTTSPTGRTSPPRDVGTSGSAAGAPHSLAPVGGGAPDHAGNPAGSGGASHRV